ncbi:hypothetical protein [Serratia symbiotica]|uniref:hypothetical protein n=1 Tax=Serratia symbiotica TaxID=138074 RepID=UPI0011F35B5F|nr:hypothetical protein [Serratia symbiotica]
MTVRSSEFASFSLTIRYTFAKISHEEEIIPVTPANRTYFCCAMAAPLHDEKRRASAGRFFSTLAQTA